MAVTVYRAVYLCGGRPIVVRAAVDFRAKRVIRHRRWAAWMIFFSVSPGKNQKYTRDDQQRCDQGTRGDELVGREIAQSHRNQGIDISVTRDTRGRKASQQPDVGRIGDQRAENNQVGDGKQRMHGHVWKWMQLPGGRGYQEQGSSPQHHPRAGRDRPGGWKRESAREYRNPGPCPPGPEDYHTGDPGQMLTAVAQEQQTHP